MKPIDRSPSGRLVSGFTLIELLVVVAIMAILAGLLLPALAAAHGAGRRIACIGNHRQLALAWQQYAGDNGQALVWTVDDGDNVRFTNWVAGHLGRADESTNAALLADRRRSVFAPYVPTPGIYRCPADPSRFCRSVSMNNRLNPVRVVGSVLAVGGYGTNFVTYRKLPEIGNASGIFVILDERYDSINEANFASDLSNTGTLSGNGVPSPFWWLDTPAGYHHNALNLSFADGHVESHTWQRATTLGPIGKTGFRQTTPDDPDCAWLQRRASEKVGVQ